MATSASLGFFPEDAPLTVRSLWDHTPNFNVVTWGGLGVTSRLSVHLSDAGIAELHRKLGEHLHRIEEAKRAKRVALVA